MGNRVNYVLKNKDDYTIYYSHWRAVSVTQDLALGEKRFVQFVKQCEKVDELLNEPWIEACVLIDYSAQKLFFWETETLDNTSIREEYLNRLRVIWSDWQVIFLENEMYGVEQQLQIQYTSKQDWDLDAVLLKNISDASDNDDFFSCLVVLVKDKQYFFRQINQHEEIILIGEPIIEKLMSMNDGALRKENPDDFFSIIIIDIDGKTLWINQSITGLKPRLQDLWKNWTIHIGNFGYINLLKKIGYETSELALSTDEIQKKVSELIYKKNDFDPHSFANKLSGKIGENIKFNQYFFDTTKPQKTFIDNLKRMYYRSKR